MSTKLKPKTIRIRADDSKPIDIDGLRITVKRLKKTGRRYAVRVVWLEQPRKGEIQ